MYRDISYSFFAFATFVKTEADRVRETLLHRTSTRPGDQRRAFFFLTAERRPPARDSISSSFFASSLFASTPLIPSEEYKADVRQVATHQAASYSPEPRYLEGQAAGGSSGWNSS